MGGTLTRRGALLSAAGVGGLALGALSGCSGGGGPASSSAPAATGRVRNLTGLKETGPFGAPYTDLAIPARCPDGSLLLVCGDTFEEKVGGPNWRSPVGLRSRSADLRRIRIDGAVGGSSATALVPDDHEGGSTVIPSDVFTVGDTMYLNVMRGVIFQADTTELWRSDDQGETWQKACEWPADLHDGQFQQKTFVTADDGWVHLVSTVFNRDTPSDLLRFRVRADDLGDPDAYEAWDGQGWGGGPVTVSRRRRWGEICLRRVEDRFVLTWLNMESDPIDIRAAVFDEPDADLTRVREQTMIVNDVDTTGRKVRSPYGGFVFPGSTFDDFHIAVSQWPDSSPTNYHVMQYRVVGLRA